MGDVRPVWIWVVWVGGYQALLSIGTEGVVWQ